MNTHYKGGHLKHLEDFRSFRTLSFCCLCVFMLCFVIAQFDTNIQPFVVLLKGVSNGFKERINDSKKVDRHNEISINSLNDLIIRTTQPKYSDQECRNISINLYKTNTFNLTGLVSYPGSGNTWLRHLIEFSTGIFTGSVYFDVDLISKGFVGEEEPWDSGSTIAQKSHAKYSTLFPFPRAIVLIREPYQAIISFVQYLESGHTGHASPSTFQSKDWPVWVLGQTFTWISVAKSWIESPADILVVYYESLLKNPQKELAKICQFVRVDCMYLHHKCFQKYLDGEFHRKATIKPKVPYSKWVRDKIDDGIDYLNALLISHGHEPIPFHHYKFYRINNSETIYSN